MSKQKIALLAAGGFVLFVFIKIFLDYRKAMTLEGDRPPGLPMAKASGNWYVQIFGMPKVTATTEQQSKPVDYSGGIWLNPNDYLGNVEDGEGKVVTVTTE